MDERIGALITELENLRQQLEATIPNDNALFRVAGNPMFCGCDREDFRREIERVIGTLKGAEDKNWDEEDHFLKDYRERIEFARNNIVPQLLGNQHAAPSLLTTLWSAREYVARFSDQSEPPAVSLRRGAVRVRALEARLKALEPRSQNLEAMLHRIEAANETAEQLPADLEQLGSGLIDRARR
jgi:hypothetical protein